MDNVIKFKKKELPKAVDIAKEILEGNLLNHRRSIQLIRPDTINDSLEKLEAKYQIERRYLEEILNLPSASEVMIEFLTELDDLVVSLHQENGGDVGGMIATSTKLFRTDLFEYKLSVVQFGFTRCIRSIERNVIPIELDDIDWSNFGAMIGSISKRARALSDHRKKILSEVSKKFTNKE